MSVLRWGLLSTARINRALIPPLKASARNRVMAVASREPAKAESYAAEWGIPRVFGSYEALLADPEIDVIYNPLPNHLHAGWTIRAVAAGKHVLCEKPLALSVQEVDAVAAAAARAGRVVMEAFMYRHHPQTWQVKELVAGGAIGDLQLIRGAFSFTLTRPNDVRLRPEWGGGALWDVGCYPVSYARLLAGEPAEVFGRQRPGPSGIDEVFVGQLEFPNGAQAQFDCGFRAPFRAQLEVVGSAGVIEVPVPYKPGLSESLRLRRDDHTETLAVAGQDLYSGEVENMADAILDGAAPRVSLADSRANVAALTALYQSAREGRPVRVPAKT
jgi:predicted dehydrogenase